MPGKTCNRCHVDGLRWMQVDDRWMLYSGDQPHICHVAWTRPPAPSKRPKHQSAFTEGVAKWEAKQPPKEIMPPEADYNYQHPWWSFLDGADPRRVLTKHMKIEEIIP